MKRIFSLIILLGFTLLLGMPTAKADSIILSNGTTLKGKIQHVLSNFVEIKTKNGIQKVIRDSSLAEGYDIVEIGFLRKRKQVGKIFFLSGNSLEMKTPSGDLKMNRIWVTNIILSR